MTCFDILLLGNKLRGSPMVREKRIVFGVEDIKAIRVQCNNAAGTCRQELVLHLENGEVLPRNCPSCGSYWKLERPVESPEFILLEMLRQIRARSENGNVSKVVLRLELNDD